jgi:hypothetical protein
MTRENRLVRDQRGAIMVMGLGAALLLIGCLWFLMGIADTLIWRDRMQEAVDAAAFSSATIHARGMNFIAAINLVMLALVTIHMVLGLIADGLTIVAALCLIPPATPAAPKVFKAAQAVRKAQNGYDMFMWPALHVLNGGQTVAAVGVPHLGTLAAKEVAGDYKVSVTAMGASNVPGIAGKGPKSVSTEDGLGGLGGMRLGLPVAYEPYKAMCRRPVYWLLDWVSEKFKNMAFVDKTLDFVRDIPIVGGWLADKVEKLIDTVFKKAAEYIGKGLVILECDDGKGGEGLPASLSEIRSKVSSFIPFGAKPDSQWGMPGSKKMWKTAENGSQWMQVWASTNGASKVDDEERKVAVGRRKFGDVGTTQVTGTYLAQAEFFYDCGNSGAKWDEHDCNGNLDETQFAVHNMKWKARLRRYRGPSFSQFIADTVFAGVDGFDGIKKAVAKIPGVDKKIGGVVDVKGIIKAAAEGLIEKGIDLLGNKPGDEIIH